MLIRKFIVAVLQFVNGKNVNVLKYVIECECRDKKIFLCQNNERLLKINKNITVTNNSNFCHAII